MPLKINDLIEASEGRKQEILIELKKLNKKANNDMFQRGHKWGNKYHKLWNTIHWKKAKQLFIEYCKLEGINKCIICGSKVDFNKCTMHHIQYDIGEYYTPLNISLIHPWCHSK